MFFNLVDNNLLNNIKFLKLWKQNSFKEKHVTKKIHSLSENIWHLHFLLCFKRYEENDHFFFSPLFEFDHQNNFFKLYSLRSSGFFLLAHLSNKKKQKTKP